MNETPIGASLGLGVGPRLHRGLTPVLNMDPVIFREYDIRGVVGRDFDASFAYALGRAYVAYVAKARGVSQPTVALGHDARLSCPELVSALAEGLRVSGAHVIHLGLVTTPMTYFTTFEVEHVDGALMVTGSHNPPDCNGFKISVGRSTLHGEEIQKLRAVVESGEVVEGCGSERRLDLAPQYIERYRAEFGRIAPLPVVLDCGNGAAGCIVRRLYSAVGLEPAILFEEPDGTFPNHHPDPTVEENLQDLMREVVTSGARVGIGFDGDADRIGVVDERGRIVYGDELLALYSRFVLAEHPCATIVGDVKSSDRLFDYIARYGGTPVMWKSGHSSIKEKVKIERAPFGGELAGHVFFADRNYGYDDALYASLRLVEILSSTDQTIGELLSDLPDSFTTPEIRIDTTEDKKHRIVDALKRVFTPGCDGFTVNLIDGLRVSFPEGWALARASNTQAVLVMRFEANSQRALQTIRARFEEVIRPLL
jgi:phosphomannomutase/phosphomannomutase/phosphoglucomutase